MTALRHDGHFVADTGNGRIEARQVVAAPGIAHFTNTPEWATDGEHTCDLVDFDGFSGARVLIVGGRQSAYEWAALLSEHGAEHVDVVHRHPQPRFAKVSWGFVDPLIEETLAHARLVPQPAARRARRDRPPLLGGRPADPRALARAAPAARHVHAETRP